MATRKYDELRKRIMMKYETLGDFARALGKSPQTVSYKLNDKSPWRLSDISAWCKLLDIPSTEIQFFFSV